MPEINGTFRSQDSWTSIECKENSFSNGWEGSCFYLLRPGEVLSAANTVKMGLIFLDMIGRSECSARHSELSGRFFSGERGGRKRDTVMYPGTMWVYHRYIALSFDFEQPGVQRKGYCQVVRNTVSKRVSAVAKSV